MPGPEKNDGIRGSWGKSSPNGHGEHEEEAAKKTIRYVLVIIFFVRSVPLW
jgi:hypothetical protein